MSAWQHLSVSPIAGALGAEVGGIQLAHLNEAAFTEVQAFLQRQVLFFPDQELTGISKSICTPLRHPESPSCRLALAFRG